MNHKLDRKTKVASEDHIYDIHEYGVDLKNNHIYLMGTEGYTYGSGVEGTAEPGVEYIMANHFIKNINLCMRANPGDPIVIHMKSCGGDYGEGMAIYDAIYTCPSPVTILNYTHARSMTSIILQAADKRVMMPHSHFMFHLGELFVGGTQKQVESNVAFSKTSTATMLDIYCEALTHKGKFKGQSVPYITKWLTSEMNKKEDVFLTAQQAVEYGFADEVFNSDWSTLIKY